MRAQSYLHLRKGKVYGSSEVSRSKSDANDLYQKPSEAKRILVKHDPSAISDQFGCDTCADNRRECPRSVFDSYQTVDDQGREVECDEGRIGRY